MENKVIASLGFCNTASLNVYKIINGIDDYIVVGINDRNPRQYKLYTTSKGTYFNFGGSRYYTHEFSRI